MKISTDRELLQKLGLAEAFVASLIGKTRQAVSGGLAGSKTYFRDGDLATVVSYCRAQKTQFLGDIEAWLRDSRPTKADEIMSAHGMFLNPAQITAATEVWFVLPNFPFFQAYHPQQLAALVARVQADTASFTLVVSDNADADAFWKACPHILAEDREAATQQIGAAAAMPYSLLLEPMSTNPQGWALVSGGFQRVDMMRAMALRSYFRDAFDPKKLRQPQELRPAV